MHESLCELRFDIPLLPGTDARRFERAWRAELAAQKMTALAMPPAQAITARFRVCGLGGQSEMDRYLAARLAALPGHPAVAGGVGGALAGLGRGQNLAGLSVSRSDGTAAKDKAKDEETCA